MGDLGPGEGELVRGEVRHNDGSVEPGEEKSLVMGKL